MTSEDQEAIDIIDALSVLSYELLERALATMFACALQRRVYGWRAAQVSP